MPRSKSTRIAAAYLANYQMIAEQHVAYWRETGGGNPFQGAANVRENEDATVELIERYSQAGDHCLDAGCGPGDLMVRLQDRVWTGVDIADAYLQLASERGLNVLRGDLEHIPSPRNKFQLVACTDVLEHVLDLNAVIRELLRVLHPGGTLIVRVPNDGGLSVDTSPYEFMHLREFTEEFTIILFQKIFGCEILEIFSRGDTLHAAVRP